MGFWSIFSFLTFTILVALISYLKTKKGITQTVKGSFFANRKNNFWVIGGALFLSNISPNQLIGENESIFINNMSVIAWGVSSVLAMLVVSEFLLPIYFKTGSLTVPDFISSRYGNDTKRLVSIIFLVSYIVNLLPSVLYGGAVAFTGLFNVLDTYHISYWQQIWIMVWFIGIIGTLYSILGGLRAITISDTVISVGLLIIGISIPYYGFKLLGDGNWLEGLNLVLSSKTEHLNAIGNHNDEVPFQTIFTGMFIMNLYYWGMEQYIVQQAMTAKSLSHSQKGMALACIGKLICPFLINLPGIIGLHLYLDLENTTQVFPKVIVTVLPSVFIGLAAAVVLGAAITTFNAGLKSCSTLFVLNIYKPYKEKKENIVSEKSQLKCSKHFELIIGLGAMLSAPFIIFSNTGFYTYLQQLAGMFSVPVFTIILIGFISKKASSLAAKLGMLFFIVAYVITNYFIDTGVHYLHLIGILFILTIILMWFVSELYPSNKKLKLSYIPEQNDLKPWQNRHYVSFFLIFFMILIFIIFSEIGIA